MNLSTDSGRPRMKRGQWRDFDWEKSHTALKGEGAAKVASLDKRGEQSYGGRAFLNSNELPIPALTQGVGFAAAVDLQRHLILTNTEHSCVADPVSDVHGLAIHDRRRAGYRVNNPV